MTCKALCVIHRFGGQCMPPSYKFAYTVLHTPASLSPTTVHTSTDIVTACNSFNLYFVVRCAVPRLGRSTLHWRWASQEPAQRPEERRREGTSSNSQTFAWLYYPIQYRRDMRNGTTKRHTERSRSVQSIDCAHRHMQMSTCLHINNKPWSTRSIDNDDTGHFWAMRFRGISYTSRVIASC